MKIFLRFQVSKNQRCSNENIVFKERKKCFTLVLQQYFYNTIKYSMMHTRAFISSVSLISEIHERYPSKG